MDREIVLAVLALLLAGPALLAGGCWPARRMSSASGRRLEHACWIRILMPMAPAAIGLSSLLGWAIAEPAEAEVVPRVIFVAAAPFAAILARALIRAARALRSRSDGPAAATVGILKPRSIFSPVLESELDSEALEAAREHERAHARHRDPLRILVAQFAADLQWPWPSARRRFLRWRQVLEIARDEEARARGVAGEDLAAAILAAARLSRCSPDLVASLASDDDAGVIEERIARLLEPVPCRLERSPGRWVSRVLLTAGLGAAFGVGATMGEVIVRAVLATLS